MKIKGATRRGGNARRIWVVSALEFIGEFAYKLARAYIVLAAVLILALALMVVPHSVFRVCPLGFARYEEAVPIVYGLPTWETAEKARTGEVVLGGCVVGPFRSACPYCGWPVALRDSSDEDYMWPDD